MSENNRETLNLINSYNNSIFWNLTAAKRCAEEGHSENTSQFLDNAEFFVNKLNKIYPDNSYAELVKKYQSPLMMQAYINEIGFNYSRAVDMINNCEKDRMADSPEVRRQIITSLINQAELNKLELIAEMEQHVEFGELY